MSSLSTSSLFTSLASQDVGVGGSSGPAPATWLGQTNVTVTGSGTITMVGGGASWTAGAYSSQSVVSGDIKIEATIPDGNTQGIIGISNVTEAAADVNFTTIDFGVFAFAGQIHVFENGVNIGGFDLYATGDEVSVEVTGGQVLYRRNGGAPFRTVASPTLNYPLCADVSLEHTGGAFVDCTITT